MVGANPLKGGSTRKAGFVVVQDMFLTETAQQADVVLPAASAYEKNGTVTNVSGEVQRLKRAVKTMGTKPDLEIMGLIAQEMGVLQRSAPGCPTRCSRRFARRCAATMLPLPVIATGGAAQTHAGERTHSRGSPARSGALRPQRRCSRPARSGAILRC